MSQVKMNGSKYPKTAAFSVEIIKPGDAAPTIVLRNMNGQPLKIVSTPEEVAEFLGTVINEMSVENVEQN